MIINELMYKKKLSKYKLSKQSSIPYSTIEDIFSNKTKIENLTLSNSIKLAKALDISINDVINLQKRTDEDLFRSMVCHDLKNKSDLYFIKKTVESKQIEELFRYNLYFESLYLLSTLDYVCRRNNIPIVKDYDHIRKHKMSEICYPKSILFTYIDSKEDLIEEFNKSIPEYKMHNIAERDIDNII